MTGLDKPFGVDFVRSEGRGLSDLIQDPQVLVHSEKNNSMRRMTKRDAKQIR